MELERLALAAVFDAYRRDVLERAWLEDALGLEADAAGRFPRLVSSDVARPREPDLDLLERDALRARFRPTVGDRFSDTALSTLRAIRPGPHARAQEWLVECAVAILRSAGCEVLIVEGPLHPISYELYAHGPTRAEFLAFARRLQDELGAHFLALEESGPYPATDFSDPLHLQKRRGRELGALTLRRAQEILGM